KVLTVRVSVPTPLSARHALPTPTHTEANAHSLHDALPISSERGDRGQCNGRHDFEFGSVHSAWSRPESGHRDGPELEIVPTVARSEEHTSELQSRGHRVCRLLV